VLLSGKKVGCVRIPFLNGYAKHAAGHESRAENCDSKAQEKNKKTSVFNLRFPYVSNMRTVCDPETLRFPCEIVDEIGLATNQIAFLKKRGCKFFGRKTSIRWVRDFLNREAGAASHALERGVHQMGSVGNR